MPRPFVFVPSFFDHRRQPPQAAGVKTGTFSHRSLRRNPELRFSPAFIA